MKNYTRVPDELLDDPNLSPGAKLLGILLFKLTSNGRPAYASEQYLADRLQCSERNVRRFARELVAAGRLTVRRRGGRKTNLYEMTGQGRPVEADMTGQGRPHDRTPVSGLRRTLVSAKSYKDEVNKPNHHTSHDVAETLKSLLDLGVDRRAAKTLVTDHLGECRRQLKWLPLRGDDIRNKPAYLLSAIRGHYPEPPPAPKRRHKNGVYNPNDGITQHPDGLERFRNFGISERYDPNAGKMRRPEGTYDIKGVSEIEEQHLDGPTSHEAADFP